MEAIIISIVATITRRVGAEAWPRDGLVATVIDYVGGDAAASSSRKWTEIRQVHLLARVGLIRSVVVR